MKLRSRRSRSIEFDFMERRQVLSGATVPAAVVGGMAIDSHASPFRLIAAGTGIQQYNSQYGSSLMLAVADGEATFVGPLHGQILVNPPQNQNSGGAIFNLVGANGSSLTITVEFLGGGGSQDGDQPQPSIRGRYWITSGTGALSGANGAGTLAVITDPRGNDFTVEMQGQIAVLTVQHN